MAWVVAEVGDPARYDEIVFCGFGEPLLRLTEVKEIAGALKGKGARIRINTDGLANLVHGRDVFPDLPGLVDALSVFLNAARRRIRQPVAVRIRAMGWCSTRTPRAPRTSRRKGRREEVRSPVALLRSVVGDLHSSP